jgi:glutamyl-tRNA reductase
LYAVASRPCFGTLEAFVAETQKVPVKAFVGSLYRRADEDAVCHLLRVAAGLDSLVLGEPQILGQVTDAYSLARKQGTAGKILSRLFQTAIHAGKRARAETAICHNPVSIASVAVGYISEIVPDLEGAQVCVVGAGEMAELAVDALRKRGAPRIQVVNRTLEAARNLAKSWGGQAETLEALPDLLPRADILITSTGAPHAIIHPPLVARAMQFRSHRPLVIMDIAVPRDVEEAVADIPGVNLFDMDSLTEGLAVSLAKREAEIPKTEAILAEEQAEFMSYLASLDVVPIIVKMRKQADGIRRIELEKALRRMPDLPSEAQEQIDMLTRSIVKKILHHPTVRLREESNGPHASDFADITRGLFGID